jgi:uncharacterized protein (DUF2147 family)
MKKGIIIAVLAFIISPFLSISQSNEADKILGTWLVGSGKAHIQIYKYADKYAGKIIWLREPLNEQGKPKVDKNNPDASKRNNQILGTVNMLGFKYAGSKTWKDGTIYDSESGKTYSCNVKMVDENTLEVRGYVGISMIGRTDTWKKVK